LRLGQLNLAHVTYQQGTGHVDRWLFDHSIRSREKLRRERKAKGYAQLGPRDNANLKPTDLERVKVGDQAPDFTLENMDGKKISLSDFRGEKNVSSFFTAPLLIF